MKINENDAAIQISIKQTFILFQFSFSWLAANQLAGLFVAGIHCAKTLCRKQTKPTYAAMPQRQYKFV